MPLLWRSMCLHEDGGKKHQCHICGNRYLTLSKLNGHALKHSEGRLSCAWCNKSSVRRRVLKITIKDARRGQGMKSCYGRRHIPSSAGIAITISPKNQIETVILRKAIQMLNNVIRWFPCSRDGCLWCLDSWLCVRMVVFVLPCICVWMVVLAIGWSLSVVRWFHLFSIARNIVLYFCTVF